MRRRAAALLAAHALGLATPGAALNGCTEGKPWAGLVCFCKAGPWETNWTPLKKTGGGRCCNKDCGRYSSLNYATGCPQFKNSRRPTNCPPWSPCNCDIPPKPCYGVTCHANSVCKATGFASARNVPVHPSVMTLNKGKLDECVCKSGYYKVAKGITTHNENKAGVYARLHLRVRARVCMFSCMCACAWWGCGPACLRGSALGSASPRMATRLVTV